MAGPLLETKFHVPTGRRGLVARPRLSEHLSRGAESKLTLVSGPAGFGKTTLLAEWVAARSADGRSAAWLSLDRGDSDLKSFWTYVVAALRTVSPAGVGSDAFALLQSPQPPVEAVLATLINDLNAISNDVTLVLDDYHVIESTDVQEGMSFLLEHLPPQIHIVIASRADPPLRLARFRGRGELVEIRAADLRFSPDEATAYLNQVMGLALTERDVAVLEERTEGWIAALQLAALSMQGRDDIAGFIARFAGDDRYIVDYLVEEVLQRQTEHVRSFLLQTSILDQLSGPLCDAVTGQHDGKAMLEGLDRGNLFVIPLDDNRQWYRYHHLFADVLQIHLTDERPDEVRGLHRRASQWYEQNDEPLPAVHHSLAAEDVERAAGLAELAIPVLQRSRQETTIRAWLEEIPDELVRARPVLGIGFVGALMAGGEFESVERRLEDIEQWLGPATDAGDGRRAGSAEMVVVNEQELPRLPTAIAMYRAGLALARGDVAGTVRHATRAMELARDDDHLRRAGASALLGLAYWTRGDLQAAHRAYAVCVEGLQRAGYVADVLGCSIAMADMQIAQGRLGDALCTYEDALRLTSDHGPTVLRGTADMYVGISQIACERDDLHAATHHLLRSQQLGEHAGLPQNPYRWRVAMARVRHAEGDPGGALDLLTAAQRVYSGDFSPNVRPIPALKARVLAAQGRWREALDWARDQGLSPGDDLSYLREFEHITLARVLLARHRAERSDSPVLEAAGLLDRLLTAAEEGERTGSVIEILALQALIHEARGDVRGSIARLERALTFAEPQGYVRLFADEGDVMASLLKQVGNRRALSRYVRRLSEACGVARSRTTPVKQGLLEPLSQRELDVLRLLGSDLDGPDIARELTVSLNTLRTHTKNIYAKLGVNSRRAAVRQAGELNLLSRTRDR